MGVGRAVFVHGTCADFFAAAAAAETFVRPEIEVRYAAVGSLDDMTAPLEEDHIEAQRKVARSVVGMEGLGKLAVAGLEGIVRCEAHVGAAVLVDRVTGWEKAHHCSQHVAVAAAAAGTWARGTHATGRYVHAEKSAMVEGWLLPGAGLWIAASFARMVRTARSDLQQTHFPRRPQLLASRFGQMLRLQPDVMASGPDGGTFEAATG